MITKSRTSRTARPSFNQEMEQFLRTLPENVRGILRQTDALFSPTKDMTNLEAHIYQCEEVAQQFYSSTESELGDPLDKIMADEEEVIWTTGQNFAGRTASASTTSITRN